MTDIIERVARAICTVEPPRFNGDETDWRKAIDFHRAAARTAIAAIREPSLAMIRAARLAMSRDDLQPTESEVEAGWRAAIDAALSENRRGTTEYTALEGGGGGATLGENGTSGATGATSPQPQEKSPSRPYQD